MASCYPRTDAGFNQWVGNFDAKVSGDAAFYGVPTELAAECHSLCLAFIDSYRRAKDPRTQGKLANRAKDSARQALVQCLTNVFRYISAQRHLTSSDRIGIGVSVRNSGRPKGTMTRRDESPAEAPALHLRTVTPGIVRLELRDASAGHRRAKPDRVANAEIYTFVGEQASTSISDWTFVGGTTVSSVDLHLNGSVKPGVRVWITARWVARSGKPGPVARALSAYNNSDAPIRSNAVVTDRTSRRPTLYARGGHTSFKLPSNEPIAA